VPYNVAFELQTFTVECWFTYDQAFTVDTQLSPLVSIEERTKAIVGYGWRLFILRMDGFDRAGFMIYRSDNSYLTVRGTTEITPGSWHHAAGVFDGTEIRLYLDGVLQGTEAYTGTIAYTDQPIGFGWPCWSGNCSFLDGGIDEVRITDSVKYTTTFTPEFEHGTPSVDIVGLWHMNEGSGTTLFDIGGNGFNGTLTTDQVWSTRP
jgi:hypothetical protein